MPTKSVTVAVFSLDSGAVTVSPASLTFTTTNWNTTQMVTLTPVDDADSNNESMKIRTGRSGGGYDGRTAVTATVTDDDSQD